MSSFIIQVFVFMSCTFALGLLLGWAVWRYDGISKKAIDSLKTEVEFWRGSLENSRRELWKEQEKHSAHNDEKANFKKRLTSPE